VKADHGIEHRVRSQDAGAGKGAGRPTRRSPSFRWPADDVGCQRRWTRPPRHVAPDVDVDGDRRREGLPGHRVAQLDATAQVEGDGRAGCVTRRPCSGPFHGRSTAQAGETVSGQGVGGGRGRRRRRWKTKLRPGWFGVARLRTDTRPIRGPEDNTHSHLILPHYYSLLNRSPSPSSDPPGANTIRGHLIFLHDKSTVLPHPPTPLPSTSSDLHTSTSHSEFKLSSIIPSRAGGYFDHYQLPPFPYHFTLAPHFHPFISTYAYLNFALCLIPPAFLNSTYLSIPETLHPSFPATFVPPQAILTAFS